MTEWGSIVPCHDQVTVAPSCTVTFAGMNSSTAMVGFLGSLIPACTVTPVVAASACDGAADARLGNAKTLSAASATRVPATRASGRNRSGRAAGIASLRS